MINKQVLMELVAELLKSPETCDRLLVELDRVALRHDHYKLGLPMHREGMVEMRQVVLRWILNIKETQ